MEDKKERLLLNQLLALAALAGEVGGAALCLAAVLLRRDLLPESLTAALQFAGGVLALVFLTAYFCLRSGRIKCLPEILKWELWLLAALRLGQLLAGVWQRLWAERLYRAEYAFAGPAALVLIAAAVVLAASFLLRRLLRVTDPERFRARTPVIFAASAVLTAALWAAGKARTLLVGLLPASVMGMLASHVFMACCVYAAACALLAVCGWQRIPMEPAESPDGPAEDPAEPPAETAAVPMAEAAPEPPFTEEPEGPETEEPPPAPPGFPRSLAGVAVPLILALVFTALTAEGLWTASPAAVERASAAVEAPIREGYARLNAGDPAMAAQYFALAEARLRALESFSGGGDGEPLEEIYEAYPDDFVIGALFLSSQDAMENVEQGVRSCTLDSSWYPALLRYYRERDGLSEKQEQLRDTLLMQYAAIEQYEAPGCLLAEDLAENRLVLRQSLSGWEPELTACRLFRMMIQYNVEGGCTEELALEALELAEEEPDQMLLQCAAYLIGSSYQVDGARHYQRTMEAAERFDRLYDDGSRTDEQLAREKLSIGDAAARCYMYETALTCCQEAYRLSGSSEAALSCAKISDKLQDYEQCLEMARSVLSQEPENTQALYLAAISALKTGDVDGALDAAGQLGDWIAAGEGPADPSIENALYVCAQYLSMSDSTSWTDYKWQVYSRLSEEQAARAGTHALLWGYMTAIHQCFAAKDYEAAERAVEDVLAIRDDLCMAWYLRGTIALGRGDYETALSHFLTAADLGGTAPAIYFSIANTYDALEDYENAWAYAKRVEEMLPYQDHGSDVYGISIHNRRLLNALERELRR